jgi:hypothetical protein
MYFYCKFKNRPQSIYAMKTYIKQDRKEDCSIFSFQILEIQMVINNKFVYFTLVVLGIINLH